MNSYRVIGIMSGTSLDGLDLAFCVFTKKEISWNYEIKNAETISYSAEWEKRLKDLPGASALEFAKTNADFGHLIGREANTFIKKHKLKVDFISSHGHTIFHQPELKFTSQIGNGSAIAAETGIDVICDFRSLDVALQGQGAPLVPIGDQLLFSEFDFRLNIGGFANISYLENGKTLAFDIAPANIALNYYVQKLGFDFDKGGQIASEGNFIEELHEKLNALDFYKKTSAKSLGREWFESTFLTLISDSYKTEDVLNTLVKHIAHQISIVTSRITKVEASLLITGGGAFNTFLMQEIQKRSKLKIQIPSNLLIDYKEALIFAFLAVLRNDNQINTLKEVTGALKDSIGGAIYKGQ